MASKNPLEEVRNHILQCQQLGIEDEFLKMGISEEVLNISNALDGYYGINRSTVCNSPPVNPDLEREGLIRLDNRHVLRIINVEPQQEFFQHIKQLLSSVKEPLTSIKNKRSSQDTFYLSLSTMIVSIALQNVVSRVNSYRRSPSVEQSLVFNLKGVDPEYRTLVERALGVMDCLQHFDMIPERKGNYEANRESLQSIYDDINTALHRRSTKNSSGCLVFLLIASTSLFMCFGGLLMFLK